MFEQSTSDARPADGTETHRCLSGRYCRAAVTVEGERIPALTEGDSTVCDSCADSIAWAIGDLADTWVALHMSIGDQTRRNGQKVSGSRSAPINLNTDVDTLKVSIVEWLVAAAALVAETLNVGEPRARNDTDLEQARTVVACTRLLSPHVDGLLKMPATDVTMWLSSPADTDYPGESIPHALGNGQVTYIPNKTVAQLTGLQIARELTNLRRRARALLDIPQDKLPLPCPYCNENQLVRSQRHINTVNGAKKQIDQIDCSNCKLNWPYDRYQQLCLIWVKEDEMERDKLQKQLDTETQKRQWAEWLLAKREWQLSLAVDCTEVSAADFAKTVLAEPPPSPDEYMTDKDIAALVNVSDSTVRSWASRGQITRHTADDGSTVFLAREVWDYAKTSGRAAPTRRNTNEGQALSG